MMTEYQNFLRRNAKAWDVPARGEWHCLFSNNYRPNYSTLALAWFHGDDQFPRVITKVFPSSEIPRREFESLRQVYASIPDRVPKPLYFGAQGDSWALWMAGVPGFRLQARAASSSASLRDVVGMIAAMHARLRVPGCAAAEERHNRLVTRPLQSVCQFGTAASVQRGCAVLAAEITPEWLSKQPIIPQHGDLFSDNILVAGRQMHIIDWESFGFVDIPLYDLLTFLLSLLRRHGQVPEEWNPSLCAHIPSLMASYVQSLGLYPSAVRLLLPIVLINWFHLQWTDGRQLFAESMYRIIDNYFQVPEEWERVFLPASNAARRSA